MWYLGSAVLAMKCQEHERDGQGDDGDVDVADVAVEDEVAHDCGERRSYDQRRGDRGHRFVRFGRQVDADDAVGVAADAEEGRLAEAEDPAWPHTNMKLSASSP